MKMEDYKKKLKEDARNRYYKLAEVLADHEYEHMKMEDIAKAIGYKKNYDLNQFLKRHGEWLLEKYGPLPFVETNGKILRRFMECGEDYEYGGKR